MSVTPNMAVDDLLQVVPRPRSDSKAVRQYIRSRQAKAVMEQSLFALSVVLISAFIVVGISRSTVPTERLGTWLLVYVCVSVGRFAFLRAYRHRSKTLDDPRWMTWNLATITVVGGSGRRPASTCQPTGTLCFAACWPRTFAAWLPAPSPRFMWTRALSWHFRCRLLCLTRSFSCSPAAIACLLAVRCAAFSR